jgi:hypothetical protein
MNQVLDWLYVGSIEDAENYERLREAGIEALLSLAYPVKYPDILVGYVPFDDGELIPEEVLYKALSFVRRKRRRDHKILIACSAGVSRSPIIAVAVLHELVGYPLVEAFRTVIHQVHSAFPHPTLWASLCHYYGQRVSINDVWQRRGASDVTAKTNKVYERA